MVIPLMKMGLGMVTTNIYYLLTAIAFSINGIADMRNRRVYSFPVILTYLLGIFISPYHFVCVIGLIFTSFLTDDRFHLKWIGAGDVDAIGLMISAIGFATIPYLTIASIMALIWSYVQHEKVIPYVYFIGLSYMIFCVKLFS